MERRAALSKNRESTAIVLKEMKFNGCKSLASDSATRFHL